MNAKRKGEPAKGLEFYSLLLADDEFCATLGRAMMAAGRLESALIRYLRQEQPTLTTTKATLGILIKHAEERTLLAPLVPVLRTATVQRNYLAHSLHALFSDLIDESILTRSDLLDSDVDSFTDHAWQLQDNLESLAALVENEVAA